MCTRSGFPRARYRHRPAQPLKHGSGSCGPLKIPPGSRTSRLRSLSTGDVTVPAPLGCGVYPPEVAASSTTHAVPSRLRPMPLAAVPVPVANSSPALGRWCGPFLGLAGSWVHVGHRGRCPPLPATGPAAAPPATRWPLSAAPRTSLMMVISNESLWRLLLSPTSVGHCGYGRPPFVSTRTESRCQFPPDLSQPTTEYSDSVSNTENG